jgi:hypothetical protein
MLTIISTSYASLVENPSGGVILVGGQSGTTVLDTLYRLPDLDSGTGWQLMKQQLKTARRFHSSTLIPNSMAVCGSKGFFNHFSKSTSFTNSYKTKAGTMPEMFL